MGVSGGAVFPPIQGAIADAANTRISYVVPTVGFVVVLGYVLTHWIRHGMHFMRVKGEAVVATSLEGAAVGGGITTVHYVSLLSHRIESKSKLILRFRMKNAFLSLLKRPSAADRSAWSQSRVQRVVSIAAPMDLLLPMKVAAGAASSCA